VALLAGCGDSSPSLDEFGQEASDKCAQSGSQIQAMGEPEGLDGFVRFAREADRVFSRLAEDLKALERPAGEDGEKATRFVEVYERELDEIYLPALREVGRLAEAGDERAALRAVERFTEVETPESDRLAREIDARACYV
jgi:hypothetical protein